MAKTLISSTLQKIYYIHTIKQYFPPQKLLLSRCEKIGLFITNLHVELTYFI